jgi:hypothetical protein
MIDKAAIVTEFLGSLKSDAGPPRFDLLTDDVTYTSSRGTVTGRDTATKYMAGPTAFTFYQRAASVLCRRDRTAFAELSRLDASL